jgi:hypothetical protein
MPSELGSEDVADAPGFEFEDDLLEGFDHLSSRKESQVASPVGAVRMLTRHFRKIRVVAEFLEDLTHFFLDGLGILIRANLLDDMSGVNGLGHTNSSGVLVVAAGLRRKWESEPPPRSCPFSASATGACAMSS